jgi:hypothetical protein
VSAGHGSERVGVSLGEPERDARSSSTSVMMRPIVT